jgi:hypothetical protein
MEGERTAIAWRSAKRADQASEVASASILLFAFCLYSSLQHIYLVLHFTLPSNHYTPSRWFNIIKLKLYILSQPAN